MAIGDDFKFGFQRQGDFALLAATGQQHGFQVQAHDTFMIDGVRVSSGRVREALLNDDLDLAERLLGAPFTIDGEVVHGQELGRKMGFPTANILLPATERLAVRGVYAVQVSIQGEDTIYQGVANVGSRPTVKGMHNQLEAHLFDMDADLYGQTLSVQFKYKIREEQKFDSVQALIEQIRQDAMVSQRFFKSL